MSVLDVARNLAEFTAFRLGRGIHGIEVPLAPHFDDESAEWFAGRLAACRMYLEFGAGGSTLAAARLGIPTISVENDRVFARAVEKALPDRSGVHLIVSELGITRKWGKPVLTMPTAARVKRWSRYVDAPFDLLAGRAPDFPDLILVDGRLRRACALESARLAIHLQRPITLCVDDFGDRPDLYVLNAVLGEPEMRGRMAIYEIGAESRPISRDMVDAAMSDYT